MSPEEIPRLVYPLEHGFDLTKGSRFMAGGGSLDITPTRRLGNHLLVEAANVLLGVHFTDLCYGFFALKRTFVESLDLRSTGFEIETELIVRAQLIGLRIAEVPSVELPRRYGQSNLRTLHDGSRVVRTLLRERRLHRAAGGTVEAGDGGDPRYGIAATPPFAAPSEGTDAHRSHRHDRIYHDHAARDATRRRY
jgi:hypothetical protein